MAGRVTHKNLPLSWLALLTPNLASNASSLEIHI